MQKSPKSDFPIRCHANVRSRSIDTHLQIFSYKIQEKIGVLRRQNESPSVVGVEMLDVTRGVLVDGIHIYDRLVWRVA